MINRRCRRCFCMNNNYANSDAPKCNYPEVIEDACDKMCPCNCNCNKHDECECGFDEEYDDVFPENPMLAQSYVPIQTMNETFKPCIALKKGTIFPELVSPYKPCDSMRDIAFIESMNSPKEGCNS